MSSQGEGPRGAGAPPGWYSDPWFAGQRRYWTGSSWTADVFSDATARPPGGSVGVAALGSPPSTPSAVAPPAPSWSAPTAPTAPWIPVDREPEPEVVESPETGTPWKVVALVLAICLLTGAAIFGVSRILSNDDQQAVAASPSQLPTQLPSQLPTLPPTQPPSATAPSPQPSPSNPAGPNTPADATLARIGLQQSDVPAGVTVGLIDGGDQVAGQTTLDLCDATYPSESLRTGRYQVVGQDSTGNPTLSTEAVRYRSAAATAQAFSELRTVAASCSTIVGRPDTSWPKTPGVDRQAYLITATDATGQSYTTLAVYLRHGDLLMGVYFPNPTGKQSPVDGKTSIPDIVHIFELRLLNPPAAGGGVSG